MSIVTSFREVYPKKKNVSKEKIWNAIMRFYWMENCVTDCYLLLSASDVVGGPSKISFKAGAITFRDACALRCL